MRRTKIWKSSCKRFMVRVKNVFSWELWDPSEVLWGPQMHLHEVREPLALRGRLEA